MIILPAIDLKDGNCVRLKKGDFDSVHTVADNPLAVAEGFYACGARQIHMVDLDGAKDGIRKNEQIVRRVAEKTGLKIELGGGIRNMADLKAVFSMGVSRAVIGSAAVTDPDFVEAAVEEYGDCVAVGIDALNGMVKTRGWTEDGGVYYLDFARQMEQIGIKTIIFTDISRDGMLEGPNLSALRILRENVSCRIIASGGVSSNQDLRDLAELDLYGAIVGKAYYAGRVLLGPAIEEAGPQC